MDAPYALRPYLSVELDRPSHLGKILPQKTKQVKAKALIKQKTSVKSLNFLKIKTTKFHTKFLNFFSQKALNFALLLRAVNELDLNF